jgi:hypothetical protein
MCEEHLMIGKGPIMQTAMAEMWELLTLEQKKKVAVMRMDMIIQLMEIKISDMEKMISLKKTAIADVQKVKEMMQQGK